ncbi:MAG TPA: biotin/lipoyl-binding protein, partial [Blastocatellia bacterium]|nr:biotin/lipoyl-binding protein [Blastocatellia bacterium]
MKIRKYKLLIVGTVGLLVAIVTVLLVRPKHASGAPAAVDPTEVEVVQVEQKDVPVYGEWIGTLDGLENADVRAQVTGYLLEQGYKEGAFVKKGQLLFQIDPRPFQSALDQAEGQLAQSQAS